MANRKAKKKKRTGQAPAPAASSAPAAAPAPESPPAEELELETIGAAPELSGALDSALSEALSAGVEEEPAAGESSSSSSAPKVEVHTLPPGQRKRRKTGRKSRRELELENKEMRSRLKVQDGEELPPAAAAPAVPIDYEAAGDLVVFLLDAVFEAIATERGDHWRLDEMTKQKAHMHGGRALGPVLPKLGNMLPWIFFGTVVGKATFSRMRTDVQIAQKKKAEQRPPAAPGSSSGGAQ